MEWSRRLGRKAPAVLIAVGVLSAMLGGFAGAAFATLIFDSDDDGVATQADELAEQRVAPSAIARRAAPAVVTVLSEAAPRTERGGTVQQTSVGSGVIIDERGFVVTNEHVIRGGERITIVLDDGAEHRASLVSHDGPFTDLAVLRIEDEGPFPTIPLGDSDALELGDPLVAIGHSLGEFDDSLTVGVVSGLHRQWLREGIVMQDLVQTDAAMNHGNSGGALLNSAGELVGISTTVIRQTEFGQAVEGIGLGISSKTIAEVALSIIERGRMVRPWIGIEHRDVAPEVAEANGLGPTQPALVIAVGAGSPAEQAGLLPNDLVVGFGGELTPERPYLNALMESPIGENVEIVVLRDGAERTLQVTPTERDAQSG